MKDTLSESVWSESLPLTHLSLLVRKFEFISYNLHFIHMNILKLYRCNKLRIFEIQNKINMLKSKMNRYEKWQPPSQTLICISKSISTRWTTNTMVITINLIKRKFRGHSLGDTVSVKRLIEVSFTPSIFKVMIFGFRGVFHSFRNHCID